MTGKKLAFPENKANINEYKRISTMVKNTYRNRPAAAAAARKTRKTRRA
jgi:hypothetical protein